MRCAVSVLLHFPKCVWLCRLMNCFYDSLDHFFKHCLIFLVLFWVVLSQLEVHFGEVHAQTLWQIFSKELLHELSFDSIIFWGTS
jgi:hypothetical protein